MINDLMNLTYMQFFVKYWWLWLALIGLGFIALTIWGKRR